MKNNQYNARDIIARKSGIIKKIICSEGEILKKENDYVSFGDVIISGNIMKDEEVKQSVAAKGKVYAEVWYDVKVEYPLNHKELIYLNDESYNINISFINKKHKLRKNYEQSIYSNKLQISDRVGLIKYSIDKERKTKYINQKLSTSKAKDMAVLLATKKISKQLTKDEHIISKKTLKFYDNGSKIEVEVFFKVYENITDYKNIE